MALKEELVEAGFSDAQAKRLSGNDWFRRRNSRKTAADIRETVDGIKGAYGCTYEQAAKTVTSSPRFFSYNHAKAIKRTIKGYGCTAEKAKKMMISHPPIAYRDPKKSIKIVTDAYGCAPEKAKAIIMSHPPFGCRNHQKGIKKVEDAYGCTTAEAKKMILARPEFLYRDHEKGITNIEEAYGCTRERAISAIHEFAPFVDLDHNRVIRQLSRIGRLAGLEGSEVKAGILEKPIRAGYSARRYVAAMDVARRLNREGISNEALFDSWKIYISWSPYVPGTNRLSMTQAEKSGKPNEEPPLMKMLRKTSLSRQLSYA